VPALGYHAAHLKQLMRDKLVEHHQFIREHGTDMPEIAEWVWRGKAPLS
jgi:xylulose-5-phosphate/fructose-6-phosphate phosphoketolase